jgi:hypothetical protein
MPKKVPIKVQKITPPKTKRSGTPFKAVQLTNGLGAKAR